MSYRLKYTQTFEKQIEKIKKKDKALIGRGNEEGGEIATDTIHGKAIGV